MNRHGKPCSRWLLWLAGQVVRVLAALAPWCATLYLQAWLASAQVWQPDQPYRGLLSVAMLAVGMAVSFLLAFRLFRPSGPDRKPLKRPPG